MSWGVMGVYLRDAITGVGTQSSIERSVGVPPGVLRSFFDEIVEAGYLTRDGDTLRLTPRGRVETDLITTAWRAWLVQELHDWLPADDVEIGSGGTPAAIGPTANGVVTDVDRTGRHRDPHGARVDAALDRIVVRLVREGEQEPV
jgi:hypothetical protein